MREVLLVLFHTVATATFFFSVYYDFSYTKVPPHVGSIHDAYGGKFKFLTFWNAILQALFFLICIFNDLFGTNDLNTKQQPLIRRFKDNVHAILGFPVATFVGATFWGLWAIDRELVLPKALDPYFPWWLNQLMHTLIVVMTWLEMVVAPRKYPTRTRGLTGLVLFFLVYLTWMHVVYVKSGIWVYPVLNVLSWPFKICFYLALLSMGCCFYVFGEALDRQIWGRRYSEAEKSHLTATET